MKELKYLWFLLGMKLGEGPLTVFALGDSSKQPELVTEHEPKALAILKKQISVIENTEGFKFHACRITIGGDIASVSKENKRFYDEFRRFLSRCNLTHIEQEDVIHIFLERTLGMLRESKDAEAGIRPLSESLWGKSRTKI